MKRILLAAVAACFLFTSIPVEAAPRSSKPSSSAKAKPGYRAKQGPKKSFGKRKATKRVAVTPAKQWFGKKGTFKKQGSSFTPGRKAPSKKGTATVGKFTPRKKGTPAPTKQWAGKKSSSKKGILAPTKQRKGAKSSAPKPSVKSTKTYSRTPDGGSQVTKGTTVTFKNPGKKAPTRKPKPTG